MRPARWVLVVVVLGALVAGLVGRCLRPQRPATNYAPRIYVADWSNHRVVRLDDMRGRNWMALGEGRLHFPVGVGADAAGRIYVSEQDRRIVRVDDRSGAGWTAYTPKGAEGKPNKCMGSWTFVDQAGHIYFTYDGNHRVVRLDDMNGTNRTAFGTEGSGAGQFRYPAGIWVDAAGRIYVADFDNFRIVRMDDMNGANWTTFGRYGSGPGEFINPCGIWGDSQGRIYVADQGNDRVVRIDDMAGTNWTAVGSFGTEPTPGKLYAPCGVCVDRIGRIYVSESSSNNRIVRMDDMSGANWTVFGTGGNGAGEFAAPMGIFVR